jgi:hypothetical protein
MAKDRCSDNVTAPAEAAVVAFVERIGWEEDEEHGRCFTATFVFPDGPPNLPLAVVWNRLPVHVQLEPPSANAAPVDRWRLIETAPKDGTTVLVGRWDQKVATIYSDHWAEDPGCWCDSSGSFLPTHWMPLPDPPTEPPASSMEEEHR